MALGGTFSVRFRAGPVLLRVERPSPGHCVEPKLWHAAAAFGWEAWLDSSPFGCVWDRSISTAFRGTLVSGRLLLLL